MDSSKFAGKQKFLLDIRKKLKNLLICYGKNYIIKYKSENTGESVG